MSESPYIVPRDGGYYIQDTRLPLDVIVYHDKDGASVETIGDRFPVLSLEQIHGALAFYLGISPRWKRQCVKKKTPEEFSKTHPPPPGMKETGAFPPGTPRPAPLILGHHPVSRRRELESRYRHWLSPHRADH